MDAIMSALVDALPTLQPHQLACIMMCFAQIGYTPNDAWMACMQVGEGSREWGCMRARVGGGRTGAGSQVGRGIKWVQGKGAQGVHAHGAYPFMVVNYHW